MGVECQILLDPPNTGVYKSGQTVSGILRYVLSKKTYFDAVVLQLNGKGKCSWSDNDEDVTRNCAKEDYVSSKEHVIRYKEVNKGTYDHHFKFALPSNIPSSYKDTYCKISYNIIAKFSRPGIFSRTKKIDKEINVIACFESRFRTATVFGLTKNPFLKTSANQIDMKVELEKAIVAPGENINLKYTIKNDADIAVSSVIIKLTKENIYLANNHFKTKKSDVDGCAVTCLGVKAKSENSSYSTVKTLRSLNSIYSNIFKKEYKLHVIAKFPFPYKDASVLVPVVIGHRVTGVQGYF